MTKEEWAVRDRQRNELRAKFSVLFSCARSGSLGAPLAGATADPVRGRVPRLSRYFDRVPRARQVPHLLLGALPVASETREGEQCLKRR